MQVFFDNKVFVEFKFPWEKADNCFYVTITMTKPHQLLSPKFTSIMLQILRMSISCFLSIIPLKKFWTDAGVHAKVWKNSMIAMMTQFIFGQIWGFIETVFQKDVYAVL